jgi:mannose-6-phosphate isomerase-like protein (cupin superfamily)
MKRPWGSYNILAHGPGYKVKVLTINPGHRTSLQSHAHRDEFWFVLFGHPTIRLDDSCINLRSRGMAEVPRGTKHRIANNFRPSPVVILEVQSGLVLSESDITRFEDDYGRVNLQNKPLAGRVRTSKRRPEWTLKPKTRKPSASRS